MKKKELLKKIEELERLINKKYYYDWSKAIVDNRGKSAYIVWSGECNIPLVTNTFTPLTNPIYEPDPILFNKYCKECKFKIKKYEK